ncbi:methyltransferase family protein [Niastella sp. OAS944]|uniref:methyltransferase family protein n=1 Tax=Niastella sp. OAS944 TaxID=2664089 RepID=UPI003488A66D|nr:protein-S-isoprenylcysteine O-methyltransferase Ste14 [Chitinophagaceae bacterium OAS944]
MYILNHIILVVLWLLFGVLHSVLAAEWFKRLMQRRLGSRYKYYPFTYSVFAALTLSGILIFQLNIQSHLLYVAPRWVNILLWLPVLAGLLIMAVVIKKYFFSLSGISVFYKHQPPVVLEQGGLNRYVRHPLYFGTLLFVWALFFVFPYVSNLLACIMITLYTITGAILEEKKLVKQFGEQYILYKRQVPMLIPRF